MSGITLPSDYAYVVAAITSTAWLIAFQTHQVVRARKAAKIEYPQTFAEQAEVAASPLALKFNCIQRAHQNTLESLTIVIASTAVLGLKHPRFAAASLSTWVVGRVLYTIGYSTGNPANRMMGARIGLVPQLALIFGSTWTAIQLVKAAL